MTLILAAAALIGMAAACTNDDNAVAVDNNAPVPARITGGTPEIRVEGTGNYLYCNDNPPIWLDGEAANVRITGNGTAASGLELIVNNASAVIGCKRTSDSKENYACGNIEISNLTIRASAQTEGLLFGGAAIGTGGGGSRKCGDITIEGSVIESNIMQRANGVYPAHIGGGSVMAETYSIGRIKIITDKSGTEFFDKFTVGTKAADEVIVGFPGGTKDWLIRWKTGSTNYFKIPWDLVSRL